MKSRIVKALIAAALAFISAFGGFELGQSLTPSETVVKF